MKQIAEKNGEKSRILHTLTRGLLWAGVAPTTVCNSQFPSHRPFYAPSTKSKGLLQETVTEMRESPLFSFLFGRFQLLFWGLCTS